jgi:intraflagellar transport protein 172
MCVWYNVCAPDQVTTIPIKGDIEDIERTDVKTEVIVDEGINQALYPLDEALISFATSIEDDEFFKAMELLDKLVISPDVEAMWRQLRDAALSAGEIKIAQRCSAALGDITSSKYLGNICEVGRFAERELEINREDYYQVRCNLALLEKDYRSAENILVNQGKVDECIELYQNYCVMKMPFALPKKTSTLMSTICGVRIFSIC